MQQIHVFRQDLARTLVVTVNNGTHFDIDGTRGFIRHVLGFGHGAAQEHFAIFFGVQQWAHLLGEAPLGHHLTGNFSSAFDVVRRTGRHFICTVNQLFCHTATVQAGNHALQILTAVAHSVLLWQVHGHTQRTTTRDDTDFVHRIVIWHDTTNNGVTRFVEGGRFFLIFGHHHGAAFRTHHDFVLGFFKLNHGHHTLVTTSSEQRRFVHQVGQICTGEAWRTTSNQRSVNIITQRHTTHVNFQDLFTTTHIWQPHHHLAVKTARTQQRWVQYIRTVSRCDNDDAFVAFKTIHLNQHLVQGLLTLIVTTT